MGMIEGDEIHNENLFSVVYDIKRPFDKRYHELIKKEHLTESEEEELKRRYEWNRMINNFVSELKQIGYRLNWSVFLIPERNYDKARKIVDKYSEKFEKKGIQADIYILRYHPESNSLLIAKLRLHMKANIEKYLKKLQEIDVKDAQKINAKIEEIFEIAKVFDVLDEVYDFYKLKFEELGLPESLRIRRLRQENLFSLLR